ncbi:MAG: hypothetical protein LBK58_07840 [Prevotellaceae bacterium]|jgi:hypothetical protein|nr:hypothetical protein [Prevotellaceae bacterium]
MAYNKDSGESKLRKGANQNAYTRKKNKNIFKNSQPAQSPPRPQRKTDYEWDIPDVDIDIDVPDTGEFGQDRKKTSGYRQNNPGYGEKESWNIFEHERQEKEESDSVQESLSFKDIVLIIIANLVVPVIGGFIFYIALSAKGHRQKAAQSIVLSAIVSIIRIMYLQHINMLFFSLLR